jgi:RNA polymerase sigma factor (sigma-70 family)
VAAETSATNPQSSPTGRPELGSAGVVVEGLFAEHGRMVLGLCRLLLRDPFEAEDAAQQVFLSAHRSVLGGSVPRDAAAWLTAIARNECRARARTRMREPLALTDLPSDLRDPLAAAIARMDVEAIWAALGELPRRQRRALLLREVGGLSYGELGIALGITRPAVESLLFRARRQLRKVVQRANLALVPIVMRDQLARFLPVPGAARVAVVGAGLGLTAAGVVALPDHDRNATHRHRSQTTAAARVPADARAPVAVTATPITARLPQTIRSPLRREHDESMGASRRDVREPEPSNKATDATPAAEQEPSDPQAPAPTASTNGSGASVEEASLSSDGADHLSGSDGSGSRGDVSGSGGSSGTDGGD